MPTVIDYQRLVGMANCYSQEAISRFVHLVTEALNHPNILKNFVKFPATREAKEQVKQGNSQFKLTSYSCFEHLLGDNLLINNECFSL